MQRCLYFTIMDTVYDYIPEFRMETPPDQTPPQPEIPPGGPEEIPDDQPVEIPEPAPVEIPRQQPPEIS